MGIKVRPPYLFIYFILIHTPLQVSHDKTRRKAFLILSPYQEGPLVDNIRQSITSVLCLSNRGLTTTPCCSNARWRDLLNHNHPPTTPLTHVRAMGGSFATTSFQGPTSHNPFLARMQDNPPLSPPHTFCHHHLHQSSFT